jgi:hypothetical protein
VDIHPPHAVHSWKDFGVQLITITAGILIALSLEGVRESIRDRALVREARENIRHELSDNQKELAGKLATFAERKAGFAAALKFTEDLLKARKTDIHTLNLGFNIAEFGTASWQTAERTGALAHMEYGEVQKYAGVYGKQSLYDQQQRAAVDRIATASAIIAATGDPTSAPSADLERFRQQVLAMKSQLDIEEQLAVGLATTYKKALE